eukprot:g16664.t1
MVATTACKGAGIACPSTHVQISDYDTRLCSTTTCTTSECCVAPSCPSDEEDTAIPDWKLCGYDSTPTLDWGWQACTELPGGKKGKLKNDGGGTSGSSSPIPFPKYTLPEECRYQGIFSYDGGRDTCRRACNRTPHCTHYAHGTDGESEWCLLYNQCDKTAPFPANQLGPWTPKAAAKPTIYKCRLTCKGGITCPPESHVQKSNYDALLCSTSTCTTSECCDERAYCADAFTCPPTHVPKGNYNMLLCSASTCITNECCDQKEDCAADFCSNNQRVLISDSPPRKCASTGCALFDLFICCHMTCGSASYDCGSDDNSQFAYSAKPQQNEISCGTTSATGCNKAKCCIKSKQKCNAFPCPSSTHVQKSDYGALLCSTTKCTRNECCDQKADCTADLCSNDQRVLISASPPRKCASTDCALSD